MDAYFSQRFAGGSLVVFELPKFDLHAYINGYEGKTRALRLMLIANSCPPLAVDALKLAIDEIKKGKDVDLYNAAFALYQRISPGQTISEADLAWAELQTRKNKQELERLESELKSYKNNLIKESIRVWIPLDPALNGESVTCADFIQMGNEDLGNFHYATGNYTEAFKAYTRMREYCTTAKNIIEMTLKLLMTSIAQGNWMNAQTQVQKAYNIGGLKTEDKEQLYTVLDPCDALTHMCNGDFKRAANTFLSCGASFVNADPQAGITIQKQVLTGNDVAVYGGLCALASMDRNELQQRVLQNSSFRQFLELEPHIRRAISFFCSAKYSNCLQELDAYRNDYMLDLYLQNHLQNIYEAVRTKSIEQYFIPYSCVSLDEMETVFGRKNGQSIEDELVDMIKAGKLNARIDLAERVGVS